MYPGMQLQKGEKLNSLLMFLFFYLENYGFWLKNIDLLRCTRKNIEMYLI